MGLFDLLCWKPPKSEAEVYMEQRNKEYARKVAEYKRREAVGNITKNLSGSVHTSVQRVLRENSKNVDGVQTLGGAIGAAANSMLSNLEKTLSSATNTLQGTQATQQHQASMANHQAMSRANCNKCDTTPSIYDGKEAALFVVKNSTINTSTRALRVDGEIQRGSLQKGDRVIITTSLETNQAVISAIIRQGVQLEYANSSAGQLTLVFANTPLMLRNGDKITKPR